MLLYNSVGPNPRVVRIFMAERGIELPRVEVDLRGGENRAAPYLAKNPSGQCPALELDDGTVIAEITAICEYLDEVTPGPSLIGSTPQERAETRMWARRVDLNILEPMANGFRLRRRAADVPESYPLHPGRGRRSEADRAGAVDLAGRADGGQARSFAATV